MPSIDMPLEELRHYKPAQTKADDFDAFWSETLEASRNQPLQAELTATDYPARGVELSEVRLNGFDGGTVFCYLMRPDAGGRLPAIVFYHGYSGRGPSPFEMLPWASQGLAVLSVDCRGQSGNSTDGAVYPGGHRPGFMTQGIEDPRRYYYRYVYTDCVRALDVMAEQDGVDPDRIAITGKSQGGALTLAAAALCDRPKLAVAEVPFLCHFRRSVDITPLGPYTEVADWMRLRPETAEQSWRTLSYVDCMNLADRITCETVMTAGLWDDVCPPSGIFAAYNHIVADKQIEVHDFMGHETPPGFPDKMLDLMMNRLNA